MAAAAGDGEEDGVGEVGDGAGDVFDAAGGDEARRTARAEATAPTTSAPAARKELARVRGRAGVLLKARRLLPEDPVPEVREFYPGARVDAAQAANWHASLGGAWGRRADGR